MRRKKTADAPPIEIDAKGKTPLGMPPDRFLRQYWQKHPLLVRNAFPGYVSPVTPEDLAGLACEETALSRIVTHDWDTDSWTLRTGPFSEAEFPNMPDRDWTLLVQDVDKWDPDIRELLHHFTFLPQWRFDDIMISFAATGGSVGAHIDQYDVFLLQGDGQRRWLIDARSNPSETYRDDVALKLLREFHPSHDWVLHPGDMLYLPPGVPHHGIAVNPCLTISVGLRAPSSSELIGDYLDTLILDADERVRYHDEDLEIPKDPFEIDAAAMARAIEALNAIRINDPDRLGDWFGSFITTYRNASAILPYAESQSPVEIEQALRSGAILQRHPWSRTAWRRNKRGASLFCNGASFSLPITDARQLAAAEQIHQAGYAKLSDHGRNALFALIEAGHYQIQEADG
ncbi:MAG: cupin domain-containing protein [Xanthomonadaceae bacterium]|jgi:50S ribosomal protein L16 3-hydroxylase|nr:cupin domain-containing protein [Xanthomonadaceae bacterium]